jgi:hypothetical protein
MRSRVHLGAVLAVLGGLLAAAAGAAPSRLPTLPAQGLIFERPSGVLLTTTGGARLAELRGLFVNAPQNLGDKGFRNSVGVEALREADPALTILFDRRGTGWVLDVSAHRLRRLTRLEAPLDAGADVRVLVIGDPSNGYSTKTIVERKGRRLLAGLFVTVISHRYAATTYAQGSTPTRVLDLVTGRQTTLPRHCTAVGVRNGIVATCVANSTARPTTLELLASGRRPRVLSTFPAGYVPESARLSPDGKWVLVYLAPGCGYGWSVLVPATGGPARFVTGEGTVRHHPTGSSSPLFSSWLGWTRTNRVVATVSSSHGTSGCEGAPVTGTFVIDPRTLDRTRSGNRLASAFWGQAA